MVALEGEFRVWDVKDQTLLMFASDLEAELPPTMWKRAGGKVGLETAYYPRGISAIKALWASVNAFHRLNGEKYSLVPDGLTLVLNPRGLQPLEEFGAYVRSNGLDLPPRLYSRPEVLRAVLRAITSLKNGGPISQRDREILSSARDEVSPPFIRTEECGYPLLVEFSDEWSSTNKEVFLSLLQGLETPKPIRVILYGLRKDRGEVWAIPTAPEDYRLKGDFPKPVFREGTLYIGVPYSFRKEKIDIAFLKEVLSWIRQTLSSYVRE